MITTEKRSLQGILIVIFGLGEQLKCILLFERRLTDE